VISILDLVKPAYLLHVTVDKCHFVCRNFTLCTDR